MNNKFICLTCGSEMILPSDHPANIRSHDGIAFRASCEMCYKPIKQKTKHNKEKSR